ncbi:hypothetical protein [Streptomyces stackebrandtii]|uniref:hypothetical protein n=1 Tax=Streptomyces stackebrandtii TaxID=3051177 RepID=UPI0028DB1836|nr:hypothetical protein [Streptomyces sp. DSM 40976]
MIAWMHRTPIWVVIVVGFISAGLFLVGTVAHVADLLHHGFHAYAWAPTWLNYYWSSLALLDLLTAALLISGKRRGTDLACVVMTTDLAANWYATYGIQHSGLAAQPGLQRLVVVTAFVLGTAPFVRRHLSG